MKINPYVYYFPGAGGSGEATGALHKSSSKLSDFDVDLDAIAATMQGHSKGKQIWIWNDRYFCVVDILNISDTS